MEKLIGREAEKTLLQEALNSKSPELIALFGRGCHRHNDNKRCFSCYNSQSCYIV